ncbi:recombinase family protein, partial [Clostridioides difficile]|nr:recombinase family protein [Clostridioides difficile]
MSVARKTLIFQCFQKYRYLTSAFDRPDFQRMIDDIEDGKINCVVTKDLSRLGRNYILTGQYTEI